MLIAQIGDVISWEHLKLLLIGGGSVPLAMLIVGALLNGRAFLRWRLVAVLVYYALLVPLAATTVFWAYTAPHSAGEPVLMLTLLCVFAIFIGPGLGLVLLASLLLPLLRRQPEGRCRRCGYNLTGNVSGTCPECSTPVGGTKQSG